MSQNKPQKQRPEVASLHDEFHPQFKRGQWIAQRIGWAIIALALLLALVGIFGSGPISRDTVASSAGDAGISIQYERWTRRSSDNELRMEIDRTNTADGSIAITIAPSFADDIVLEDMTPPPDQVFLTPDGARYEWSATGAGQNLITVTYRPERWRTLHGRLVVEADGEQTVMEFEQIVLP